MNPILREQALLQQVCHKLGWEWNGPESFDKERFLQEVNRVKVMPDGEIILQKPCRQPNLLYGPGTSSSDDAPALFLLAGHAMTVY